MVEKNILYSLVSVCMMDNIKANTKSEASYYYPLQRVEIGDDKCNIIAQNIWWIITVHANYMCDDYKEDGRKLFYVNLIY
jgi:hypothetical protein